jgi:hypothetical protein
MATSKKRQIMSEPNLVLNSRMMKFQHELRVAKFMALLLVIFMFCWTPFAITLIIQSATEDVNIFMYIVHMVNRMKKYCTGIKVMYPREGKQPVPLPITLYVPAATGQRVNKTQYNHDTHMATTVFHNFS